MNELKFECPHCKQSLEASEDLFGESINCPTCNETLTVPFPQSGNSISKTEVHNNNRTKAAKRKYPPWVWYSSGIAAGLLMLALALMFWPSKRHSPTSRASGSTEQLRRALEQNLTFSGTMTTKQTTKREGTTKITFYLTILDVSIDNQSDFDIEFGTKLAFYEMNADGSVIIGAVVEWGLEPIEYGQKLKRTDLRTRYLLPDHEMRYADDSVVRYLSFTGSKGSFMAALSLINRQDEQKDDELPVFVRKRERGVFKMNITQSSWVTDGATVRIQAVLPEIRITHNNSTESFVPFVRFKEAGGERPGSGDRLWNIDDVKFVHLNRNELTGLAESIDSVLPARIFALNWFAEHDPHRAGQLLVDTAKRGKPNPLLRVCLDLMSSIENPALAGLAEGIFKAQDEPLGLRFSSFDYLVTIGNIPDLRPLIDTAIHQDSESRRAIIVKLGNMGTPQAKEALLSLLEVDSIRSNHQQIRSNLKKYEE